MWIIILETVTSVRLLTVCNMTSAAWVSLWKTYFLVKTKKILSLFQYIYPAQEQTMCTSTNKAELMHKIRATVECNHNAKNSSLLLAAPEPNMRKTLITHLFGFRFVQGHRCWYQSKARSRFHMSYNSTLFASFYNWAKIRRYRPLLKGCVTLRLNRRLKGYVYSQHPYIVRPR